MVSLHPTKGVDEPVLTIRVRARLSWVRSGLAASRLALGCEAS